MVVKFTGVEDDELREYCFQAFEAFIRRYTQSHVSITLGDNKSYTDYNQKLYRPNPVLIVTLKQVFIYIHIHSL